MAETRIYSGVTELTVRRMRELGSTTYGMIFDPPHGSNSIASSRTPLGEWVVELSHDSIRDELTLTLVKKPTLLASGMLWSAFAEALARVREET